MKEYFVNIVDVAKMVAMDGPQGIDPQYICPHYSTCRTAQSAPLPMDFCTMYKCATFYHLRKNNHIRQEVVRIDIGKIVEQHLEHPCGNGNGHSNGNGNRKANRVSPIAASFT